MAVIMTQGISKIEEVENAVANAQDQADRLSGALARASNSLSSVQALSKSEFVLGNVQSAQSFIQEASGCIGSIRAALENARLLVLNVRDLNQGVVESFMTLVAQASTRLDSWASQASLHLTDALKYINRAAGTTANAHFHNAMRLLQNVQQTVDDFSATAKNILTQAQEAARP